MTKNEPNLQMMRVVVFEEEDMYVAQCLEKDLGAQGRDLDELFNRLLMSIVLESPHLDNFKPAPQKYFDMWDKPDMLPVPVPMPVEARILNAHQVAA